MLRPYLILATIATVAACASRTVRLPPPPPVRWRRLEAGRTRFRRWCGWRSPSTRRGTVAPIRCTRPTPWSWGMRASGWAHRGLRGFRTAAAPAGVTIAAASATVEGGMAWVPVDYQWVKPAERRVEAGRATFICERREGGWKIVHAHSSQPLPWEP